MAIIKYKVVTTFCDDVQMDSTHDLVEEATKAYANRVAEAIEPTSTHPHARHVRKIEFLAIDEHDNDLQYTSAGPFGCADREAVTV
jgi:hypothetical protein